MQRVSRAEVAVDGATISSIERGFVTLLGIAKGDTDDEVRKLIRKIVELRVFEDPSGKMNLSLLDVGGAHLIVSQFTLLAETAKGRRPSFAAAEEPHAARLLYEAALSVSQELGVPTSGGRFQAEMRVMLVNDGPVTLILDV